MRKDPGTMGAVGFYCILRENMAWRDRSSSYCSFSSSILLPTTMQSSMHKLFDARWPVKYTLRMPTFSVNLIVWLAEICQCVEDLDGRTLSVDSDQFHDGARNEVGERAQERIAVVHVQYITCEQWGVRWEVLWLAQVNTSGASGEARIGSKSGKETVVRTGYTCAVALALKASDLRTENATKFANTATIECELTTDHPRARTGGPAALTGVQLSMWRGSRTAGERRAPEPSWGRKDLLQQLDAWTARKGGGG
ncbi:hypothetical protein LXA43DRAFT_4193 [Ganoderma leucocontextum]|nr:hypothetical protein LXA43DRAFT_4193 [Ganoderma leucocontextum]